jgi:putative DNA methylase
MNKMNRRRQSIEANFPIEPLSHLAQLESWRKEVSRPTYYVHKWWARRLGSVFRAILLGTLLDESEDVWSHFYRSHEFSDRIILDPFMGGGTTLGEAVKLGCRVVGSDINPVSWYLVRSSLQRVNKITLDNAFRRLEKEVAPCIQQYYRSTWAGQPAEVLYAFWVKTIQCPGCQTTSRLFPNWIFAKNAYPKRKPEAQTLCPACGSIYTIHYQTKSATCPTCGHNHNPQTGPARRTTFVCESCQREYPIAETYRLAEDPPGHQLYALLLLLPDGRKVYKQPDAADIALYQQAVTNWEEARSQGALFPQQEISSGINTNQMRGYNYHYWYQMFNPRQLLCLSFLLEGILREPDQAVKEQLLLLFSGTLEFNNMFCSYKGEGTGAVRPLFSHHILKPERMPLENNLWGTSKSSGAFSTLFKRRLLTAQEYATDPFELKVVNGNGQATGKKIYRINQPISVRLGNNFDDLVTGKANAFIHCGDSASLPLPDNSIDAIVTDPPYFDNVHYSELADFFYVWLKLASDRTFIAESTRHMGEVQDTDAQAFENGLTAVFEECHRVLKPDGLMVFTFQHAREEAWLALIRALERAQFKVIAAHPVKAEMAVATPKSQAKEPINLDIVFVCRLSSALSSKDNGISTDIILRNVRESVLRLHAADLSLSRGDLFVIAMSYFVLQCTECDSSDKRFASLSELRLALEQLSTEDLMVEQPVVRQPRLLDESSAYTMT